MATLLCFNSLTPTECCWLCCCCWCCWRCVLSTRMHTVPLLLLLFLKKKKNMSFVTRWQKQRICFDGLYHRSSTDNIFYTQVKFISGSVIELKRSQISKLRSRQERCNNRPLLSKGMMCTPWTLILMARHWMQHWNSS